MEVTLESELIDELTAACGEENMILAADKVGKLSKDFYWYSPVLKPMLDDKTAGCVAQPEGLEKLKAVVSACCKYNVPITVRGGGTGNYGQQVPLYGGVIIDMAKFNKIISLKDGVARVEPGARLGTIEVQAREIGYELRCLPSTWVKSSMAGFFCGGSGGIGSITWGGIIMGDNVKSVTILSAEPEPRLVKLEERDALKALHTYGTNGIMVEVEMRLAPKVDYQQLIFCDTDWDKLFDWSDAFARREDVKKRLVTQFENPTPTYFKPLRKYFQENEHATFIMVEQARADEIKSSAEAAGLRLAFDVEFPDPPKPPYITDYTWNHTTLWAMKTDPTITYIQAGFGENFKEKMEKLWAKFPGEILMHIEWVAGNSKMDSGVHRPAVGPEAQVGGIPLILHKSNERLQEIMDYCAEIGVFIANPHTYVLEEGGNHPDIAEKRAFKAEMDPQGLLNPGKMKTYEFNPFATASTN
jgi:FAD/FMN-containing dehydrogenase